MVFALDLSKKTASCWPLIDDKIDQETTITLKLERLQETKVITKGEVKKTAGDVACTAFKTTIQNHKETSYRKETRKTQVLSKRG